jgi:hypothetical protein
MTISNNAVAKRTTVQIPTASGDMIEAWVYLPEGRGPAALEVARRAPGAELFRSSGGHYDVYEGGRPDPRSIAIRC